jgi:hypothetical protein
MARVPDTQENVLKCVCGGCPSYNSCMSDHNEILYCAREKSLRRAKKGMLVWSLSPGCRIRLG